MSEQTSLIADETEARLGTAQDVEDAFGRTVRALADAAIQASDGDDDTAFARALSYRSAVRRMADRWKAGEASPTRSAKGEKGEAS